MQCTDPPVFRITDQTAGPVEVRTDKRHGGKGLDGGAQGRARQAEAGVSRGPGFGLIVCHGETETSVGRQSPDSEG